MNEKLTRSKNDKIIAGVCGGVARYFDVDAALIRLLWVVSIALGGVGFLAYIVAMVILPTDRSGSFDSEYSNNDDFSSDLFSHSSNIKETQVKRRALGGVILIGLGALLFLKQFFGWLDFKHLIPIILIVVGVVVILNGKKG